ncbi:arsenate reductase ArsC [Candidatus Obscuribacterales bacterium]|nr:arsenate reductase ArsC [Candidatus Obscuribacterales bacterium]
MKVLFICVENSCRSQIAEGFGRHLGLEAESAGVNVGSGVHPNAVPVMEELGIDISKHSSKPIDQDQLAEYDFVISMCSEKTTDFCPSTFIGTQENWNIECPKGQPIEFFRRIRDEIRAKVEELARAKFR